MKKVESCGKNHQPNQTLFVSLVRAQNELVKLLSFSARVDEVARLLISEVNVGELTRTFDLDARTARRKIVQTTRRLRRVYRRECVYKKRFDQERMMEE